MLQATETLKLVLGIGDHLSDACCILMHWPCAFAKPGLARIRTA